MSFIPLVSAVEQQGERGDPSNGTDGLRVELGVRDDGRGFDLHAIPPERLGLGIMRERAESVGARLTIESRVGCGTSVMVVWDDGQGRSAR